MSEPHQGAVTIFPRKKWSEKMKQPMQNPDAGPCKAYTGPKCSVLSRGKAKGQSESGPIRLKGVVAEGLIEPSTHDF